MLSIINIINIIKRNWGLYIRRKRKVVRNYYKKKIGYEIIRINNKNDIEKEEIKYYRSTNVIQ